MKARGVCRPELTGAVAAVERGRFGCTLGSRGKCKALLVEGDETDGQMIDGAEQAGIDVERLLTVRVKQVGGRGELRVDRIARCRATNCAALLQRSVSSRSKSDKHGECDFGNMAFGRRTCDEETGEEAEEDADECKELPSAGLK